MLQYVGNSTVSYYGMHVFCSPSLYKIVHRGVIIVIKWLWLCNAYSWSQCYDCSVLDLLAAMLCSLSVSIFCLRDLTDL